MQRKDPFSGSSKLFRCSNGLENARPVSFLEHTTGALIMAEKLNGSVQMLGETSWCCHRLF